MQVKETRYPVCSQTGRISRLAFGNVPEGVCEHKCETIMLSQNNYKNFFWYVILYNSLFLLFFPSLLQAPLWLCPHLHPSTSHWLCKAHNLS